MRSVIRQVSENGTALPKVKIIVLISSVYSPLFEIVRDYFSLEGYKEERQISEELGNEENLQQWGGIID